MAAIEQSFEWLELAGLRRSNEQSRSTRVLHANLYKRLSFAGLRPAGDHQACQEAAAGVGQQFETPVVQAGNAVDDG